MTEAKWAWGTTLNKEGEDPIAEITNIAGLDLDSDEEEVTHLESPDGFEEVIQTIKRTGIVTIEGNFVPGGSGQKELMDDYISRDVSPYIIDFSGAGIACEWNFDAFVKKAPSTEAPVDGKIPFSAELRVTGKPSQDVDYSGDITDIDVLKKDGTTSLTLAPTYAGGTYEYVTDTDEDAVKFNVTGDDTLKVNGKTVTTTEDTDALPLGAVGSVTTFVVSRKETGKIPQRYKFYVARTA